MWHEIEKTPRISTFPESKLDLIPTACSLLSDCGSVIPVRGARTHARAWTRHWHIRGGAILQISESCIEILLRLHENEEMNFDFFSISMKRFINYPSYTRLDRPPYQKGYHPYQSSTIQSSISGGNNYMCCSWTRSILALNFPYFGRQNIMNPDSCNWNRPSSLIHLSSQNFVQQPQERSGKGRKAAGIGKWVHPACFNIIIWENSILLSMDLHDFSNQICPEFWKVSLIGMVHGVSTVVGFARQ